MRRLLSLIFAAVVLCLFGFANSGLAADEPVSAGQGTVKPLIKCSTCGVEFTSQAGLEEHLKAFPEHKAVTAETAKPLIKCATCGVEFTSQAGVVDHIKTHPDHKAIIKCATCGVEFTSGAAYEEHMKTQHPVY